MFVGFRTLPRKFPEISKTHTRLWECQREGCMPGRNTSVTPSSCQALAQVLYTIILFTLHHPCEVGTVIILILQTGQSRLRAII